MLAVEGLPDRSSIVQPIKPLLQDKLASVPNQNKSIWSCVPLCCYNFLGSYPPLSFVAEMSHRGPEFNQILKNAVDNLTDLL